MKILSVFTIERNLSSRPSIPPLSNSLKVSLFTPEVVFSDFWVLMFFSIPDVAFISCYSDLASRIVYVASSLWYDETVSSTSSTASCLL